MVSHSMSSGVQGLPVSAPLVVGELVGVDPEVVFDVVVSTVVDVDSDDDVGRLGAVTADVADVAGMIGSELISSTEPDAQLALANTHVNVKQSTRGLVMATD